jgi:hypothetical protein
VFRNLTESVSGTSEFSLPLPLPTAEEMSISARTVVHRQRLFVLMDLSRVGMASASTQTGIRLAADDSDFSQLQLSSSGWERSMSGHGLTPDLAGVVLCSIRSFFFLFVC